VICAINVFRTCWHRRQRNQYRNNVSHWCQLPLAHHIRKGHTFKFFTEFAEGLSTARQISVWALGGRAGAASTNKSLAQINKSPKVAAAFVQKMTLHE
jgi:hypothetical protein